MAYRFGKLIGEAESFAAGCSRSRLELRLVDALKAEKARADAAEKALSDAQWSADYDRRMTWT